MKTFARILIGCLAALTSQAQAPYVKPLCPEAIEWKGRYERTRALLDSTRAVGDRLLIAKADRIKDVVTTGNQQLKQSAKREAAVKTLNGQYKIGLRLLAAELQKEVDRSRFLGFGRKRAVRRLKDVVDQLLDY